MFGELLPDIDLGAWAGPAIGGAVVLVFGYVFVWGGFRSFLAGDGHYGIIEAYVGFVRHGKTMLAVQDCIKLARQQGGILASNIGITAEGVETVLLALTDDGLDLDTLTDLALRCRSEDRALVLLIDEAGIVMPSRQWATFPVGLMWLLQQSGKLRVTIRYTTQHPMFVDTQLRSLTAVVHNVRATPPPSIARRMRGKRPWFMTVETTIPGDFDKPDKVMWRRRIRYRRSFELAYDTDAAVLPPRRVKGGNELASRLGIHAGKLHLDPRLVAQLESRPAKERGELELQLRRAASLDVGPADHAA